MATDVGASRLDPDERGPPAISNCHVVVSDQVKAPSLCFLRNCGRKTAAHFSGMLSAVNETYPCGRRI